MESTNKELIIHKIQKILFFGSVILVFLFSLGFFTNLVQIRGADRSLYDLYQGYVRMVFNLSLGALILVLFLRMSRFSLSEKFSVSQFLTSCILALGMIVLSVYSLSRLPGFLVLYSTVDLEDVRMFYSSYEYNDSVFYYGYAVFGFTILSGTAFLASVLHRTFGKGGTSK